MTIKPDLSLSIPDELGALHFVGIGGSGMSGIARLFLESGYTVTGSDVRHSANIDALPARFQLKTQDELLEALALGDISPGQVARALHETIAPAATATPSAPFPLRAPTRGKDAIVIEGVGNLMTQLAKCCQPLPGDAVAGFITRGRGVSVHRADCKQLARLRERDAGRVIEVEWGERKEHAYEVNVVVRGYDRKWLHKDITNVIAAANAHLIAINTQVDRRQGLAEMNFALRVTDFGQLSGLLARLATVPNVLEARRVT